MIIHLLPEPNLPRSLLQPSKELAADNSKFTATFANTLMNNKNACIPIETVVKSVTAAVTTDKGQKPKFGRIQGLDDMNGTFFFIAK